jgi:formylglycine-generating enzyme required for sulfatase activity
MQSISTEFDAYHIWLGIPPKDQAPDHYQLLGVERFESDPDVIEYAYQQRVSFLQDVARIENAELATELCGKLREAQQCLFDHGQRATYDATLPGQPPASASPETPNGEFDPYRSWLGIGKEHQPPNYYRLLNIELFESNEAVIRNAADTREGFLRSLQVGARSKLASTLRREVAGARGCLLSREDKAKYDCELREDDESRPTERPETTLSPVLAEAVIEPSPAEADTSRPVSGQDTDVIMEAVLPDERVPIGSQIRNALLRIPSVVLRWARTAVRPIKIASIAILSSGLRWAAIPFRLANRLLRWVVGLDNVILVNSLRIVAVVGLVISLVLPAMIMHHSGESTRIEPVHAKTTKEVSATKPSLTDEPKDTPIVLDVKPVSPQTIRVGRELKVPVELKSPDNWFGEVRYSIESSLPDARIDSTGVLSWTPRTPGMHDVRVKVTSDNGDEAIATFEVRVLPSPTLDELVAVDLGGGTKLETVLIPAGEFVMGSPRTEGHRDEGEHQHPVRIIKSFYLGKYEVTQEQYAKVMVQNPSRYKGDAKRPVEMVSWDEAVEFCRRLSQKEGKKFRLPTEAEWEYACRAGTGTPFNFGGSLNGKEANCDGENPYGTSLEGPYLSRTTKVGSYAANGFGLHDMHGNVSEWCHDWYAEDYYENSPEEDPRGPSSGLDRVKRGGCWISDAHGCRSAFRGWHSPGDRNSLMGFRVVLVPDDVGTVSGPLAADYAEEVNKDKPVVFLRFGPDRKVGVYHGTIRHTDGPKAIGGTAAVFDGSSYVEIPASEEIDLDTLSVELWFKSEQGWYRPYWPCSAALISRATAGPGSGDWMILGGKLHRGGDNGCIVVGVGTNGTRDMLLSSQTGLNDGKWRHMVWTRDKSGANCLYTDGTLVATGNDGGGTVVGDRPLQIGGDPFRRGAYLKGSMAEVAIYPSILSAERVKAHAIAGGLNPKEATTTPSVASAPPIESIDPTGGAAEDESRSSPFDDLPATGNLTLPKGTAQVGMHTLGNLILAPGQTVNLRLIGGDHIVEPSDFAMTFDAEKGFWVVWLLDPSQKEQMVAAIAVRDGSILFRWAPTMPSKSACALLNCGLEINVDGQSRFLPLGEIEIVDPLTLNLIKGTGRVTLSSGRLDNTKPLRLEIVRFDGGLPHARFEREKFILPGGTTEVRFADPASDLRLNIEFQVERDPVVEAEAMVIYGWPPGLKTEKTFKSHTTARLAKTAALTKSRLTNEREKSLFTGDSIELSSTNSALERLEALSALCEKCQEDPVRLHFRIHAVLDDQHQVTVMQSFPTESFRKRPSSDR